MGKFHCIRDILRKDCKLIKWKMIAFPFIENIWWLLWYKHFIFEDELIHLTSIWLKKRENVCVVASGTLNSNALTPV